jgi:hypothetical protein
MVVSGLSLNPHIILEFTYKISLPFTGTIFLCELMRSNLCGSGTEYEFDSGHLQGPVEQAMKLK